MFKLAKFGFPLLMTCLLGCGCEHTQSYFSGRSSEITNFHKVNENLYRSGRLFTKGDVDQIKQDGIQIILSVDDYQDGGAGNLASDEKKWAEDAGLRFEWVPMDGLKKPTVEQVRKALGLVLQNSTSNTVLVHCRKGSDRTGIVIAAYRMKHDKWDYDQARNEMKEYGHSPLLYWWDSVLNDI